MPDSKVLQLDDESGTPKTMLRRTLTSMFVLVTGVHNQVGNVADVMDLSDRAFFGGLVEIEDDLKDYEKDVEKGAFNIYAAFVRRYGAAAL